MRVDGSALAIDQSPATFRIAVVAALDIERRAWERSGRPRANRPQEIRSSKSVTSGALTRSTEGASASGAPIDDTPIAIAVERSGPGPERAGRAAGSALAAGAHALVSWGLAAGLEPRLGAGTVVVPCGVVLPDGTSLPTNAAWQATLARELRARFSVSEGDLLATADLLAAPRAKARAALTSGAVAADMESGAIAAAAEAAGVPFVAVRVIVDTLTDSLPNRAERFIDAHGRRRLLPAIEAAFTLTQWPRLWVLARRYRDARRVLHDLARDLRETSFLWPHPSALPRARCNSS